MTGFLITKECEDRLLSSWHGAEETRQAIRSSGYMLLEKDVAEKIGFPLKGA